jgi:hypothetical protein
MAAPPPACMRLTASELWCAQCQATQATTEYTTYFACQACGNILGTKPHEVQATQTSNGTALLDPETTWLSAFPNAKTSTPRPQPVSLKIFLDAIAQGQYAHVITQVRALRKQYVAGAINNAAYQAFKETHLEAVTPGGVFEGERKAHRLVEHSGCMIGDLDDLPDPTATKARLMGDPYIISVFRSPGGEGLKIIARIPKPGDAKANTQAWQALADYLGVRYGLTLDPSGKDVNRLCYVSVDPDLYYHPHALPLPLPPTRPRRGFTTGDRPGDALNGKADQTWWQQLLEAHGWTVSETAAPAAGVTYWTRPGKDAGVSTSVGWQPDHGNGQQ